MVEIFVGQNFLHFSKICHFRPTKFCPIRFEILTYLTRQNLHSMPVCYLSFQIEIESPLILFGHVYPKKTEVSNVLRIFEGNFWKSLEFLSFHEKITILTKKACYRGQPATVVEIRNLKPVGFFPTKFGAHHGWVLRKFLKSASSRTLLIQIKT